MSSMVRFSMIVKPGPRVCVLREWPEGARSPFSSPLDHPQCVLPPQRRMKGSGPSVRGMRVRCDHMKQSVLEEFFSAPSYLRAEAAGQTHGRHLAKTAHPDHLGIPPGAADDFKVSLRMADEGKDPLSINWRRPSSVFRGIR